MSPKDGKGYYKKKKMGKIQRERGKKSLLTWEMRRGKQTEKVSGVLRRKKGI